MAGYRLDEDAFRRTERVVLDNEQQAREPRDRKKKRNDSPRPPIRAILLEDLPSEGTADAAVTERIRTNEVQEVSILGAPTAGTFRLKFGPSTSAEIPWNATAPDLRKKLEALESIGKGNVLVSLGKSDEFNPGVWLVTFIGKFNGLDVALLEPTDNLVGAAIVVTTSTVWADSGRIENVRAIIPVGSPTPMRRGAVVCCAHFPGSGYGVIACECRDLNPYAL